MIRWLTKLVVMLQQNIEIWMVHAKHDSSSSIKPFNAEATSCPKHKDEKIHLNAI